MNDKVPTDFSFDIYPGLDRELEDVYARNVAAGISEEASQDSIPDLAGTVNSVLQPTTNIDPQSLGGPEVSDLLADQLTQAANSWRLYEQELRDYNIAVPGLAELTAYKHDLKETLHRFDNFMDELHEAEVKTPDNESIEMKVVLMPWGAMRANLDDFGGFIRRMRTKQGIATSADYINSDLQRIIASDQPLYRDALFPDGSMQTAKQYLDERIVEDGNWGIAFVQVNSQAGTSGMVGKSPNELTVNGGAHCMAFDEPIDNLGIFEWIALTFQEDPRRMSNKDVSWLLANRVTVDGGAYVPDGSWRGARVESYLYRADDRSGYIRPRLAVM